jgi:hypothetical protein
VFKYFVWSVALVVAIAGTAAAQAQSPRAAAPNREQQQARYTIYVMEGVLERAVELGADQVRRQVRRLMPDMLLMSGAADARGVRLEGYGVFFDVEVPVLRRSVAWSLRTMMDDSGMGMGMSAALQQLKTLVERVNNPQEKANLQQAIKRIELQVGPVQPLPAAPQVAGPPARGTVSALEAAEAPQAPAAPTSGSPTAPAAAAASPQLTAIDQALLTNPSEAYEKEVITALIDAMLDHGGPLSIGPDEWLTVAARDNEHRDRLTPGDNYDLMTIILRVKGSDLAAYRADRITKEDARKRVEIREF